MAVTVTQTLQYWLEGLELDEAGKAKAAIASSLAERLDAYDTKDIQGVASVARELRALVDDIIELSAARDELVEGLFAGVRDAEKP